MVTKESQDQPAHIALADLGMLCPLRSLVLSVFYAKSLCLSTDITNVCFEKTRNGISNDNDTDKKINK